MHQGFANAYPDMRKQFIKLKNDNLQKKAEIVKRNNLNISLNFVKKNEE